MYSSWKNTFYFAMIKTWLVTTWRGWATILPKREVQYWQWGYNILYMFKGVPIVMEQIAGRVCAHISEMLIRRFLYRDKHWGEVYTHQSIILLSFKHAYRPLTHEYTYSRFCSSFPRVIRIFQNCPRAMIPRQSPQSIIPRVANLPRVSYPSKSVF